MPELRLFARKWYFSSDELPLLAPWGAVFHGIWAGVLVWGATFARPHDCDEEVALNVWIYGVLLSFALSLVVDVALTWEGLKGSIFDTDLRENVTRLLYLQTGNLLVKIVLTAFGTSLVFEERSDCLQDDDDLRRALKFFNISTWVVIGIFFTLSMLTHNLMPASTVVGWKKRIRCINLLCCGGFGPGGDDDPLARVAWVLGSFFNPMDFTPLDMVTAMILAAHRQEFRRRAAVDKGPDSSTTAWLQVKESFMEKQHTNPISSSGPTQEVPPHLRQDWGNHVAAVLSNEHDSEKGVSSGGSDSDPFASPHKKDWLASALHPNPDMLILRVDSSSKCNVPGSLTDRPNTEDQQSLEFHTSMPSLDAQLSRELLGSPGDQRTSFTIDSSLLLSGDPSAPDQHQSQPTLLKKGSSGAGTVANLDNSVQTPAGRIPAGFMPLAVADSALPLLEEEAPTSLGRASKNGHQQHQDSVNTVPGETGSIELPGLSRGPGADEQVPRQQTQSQEKAFLTEEGSTSKPQAPLVLGRARWVPRPSNTQNGTTGNTQEGKSASITRTSTPSLQSVGSNASFGTAITWGDSFSVPFTTPPGLPSAPPVADLGTVPLEDLERAVHYHRYAVAAYGALLYLAHGRKPLNTTLRCCNLCIRATPPNSLRRGMFFVRSLMRSGYFHAKHSTRYGAINSSRVNLRKRLNDQALLRYDIEELDVVCRSHDNFIAGTLPYFVAVDRKYKALVVSIRGTLSLSDVVTDFLIKPEPLHAAELREMGELLGAVACNTEELEAQISVHCGILQVARSIIADLDRQRALECLRPRVPDNASPHPPESLNLEGWGLVITGHSLGAGVAALVALLLRGRYPEVTCWAISPPGGLMSPTLAEAISPFCTSFVFGKDIIPRLTLGTLERLRDEMVQAVAQCRRSKASILLGGFRKKKWQEAELFCREEDVPPQAFAAFQRYKASVQNIISKDGLGLARKFVPPGKLIYLRPRKVRQANCKFHRTYEAVWTTGQKLTDEGILFSPRSMTNHIPYNSYDTLLEHIRGAREQQNLHVGSSAAAAKIELESVRSPDS